MVPLSDGAAWSIYQTQISTRENVQKMGAQAAQIGDAALLAENARLALAGGAIAQHLGDMLNNSTTPAQLAADWAVYRPVANAFTGSLNALMLRMMAAPKVAQAVSYTSVPVPVATQAQVAQVAALRVPAPQAVQVVGGTALVHVAQNLFEQAPVETVPAPVAPVAPQSNTAAVAGAQKLIAAGVVLKLLSLVL